MFLYIIICNNLKIQKGVDKNNTLPYNRIREGGKYSDTIKEKKVEKEVPEVLERMGNYMGRI